MAKMADEFFHGEPFTFVTLASPNAGKRDYASESFTDVRYVEHPSELSGLKDQNVLLTDHTLYELLAPSGKVCYLPAVSREKLDALFSCINGALLREVYEQHTIRV